MKRSYSPGSEDEGGQRSKESYKRAAVDEKLPNETYYKIRRGKSSASNLESTKPVKPTSSFDKGNDSFYKRDQFKGSLSHFGSRFGDKKDELTPRLGNKQR